MNSQNPDKNERTVSNFLRQLALEIAHVRLQSAMITTWLIQIDDNIFHGTLDARQLEQAIDQLAGECPEAEQLAQIVLTRLRASL